MYGFTFGGSRRLRASRRERLAWVLTILLCTFLVPARADPAPAYESPPANFDRTACYLLVQDTGRMIAWARWEKGFSLERVQAGHNRQDIPAWMVDLVDGWIADAYAWRATEEQVRQWAEELGDTSHLPRADRLSKHETIAIWLRRIGRQCASHAA